MLRDIEGADGNLGECLHERARPVSGHDHIDVAGADANDVIFGEPSVNCCLPLN